MPTRRQFLGAAAAAPVAVRRPPVWVGVQSYPWKTFAKRAGRPDTDADVPALLAEVAKTGADGFEGVAATPEAMQALGKAAKAAGVAMRSVYIPVTLHEPMTHRANAERFVKTAREAKAFGISVVVTNPAPISWVAPLVDKTDSQLGLQATALGWVGKALAADGLTLAYHTHDMEMRQAAREFHHMLVRTDPADVSFCFDVHWVYRGSGDSEAAVFDVLKLYGKRVAELHLRQSKGGVWTEAFGRGDLDYPRLAVELAELGVKPLLVLEQAVEAKSPTTLDVVEAHKQSLAAARAVFGAVRG